MRSRSAAVLLVASLMTLALLGFAPSAFAAGPYSMTISSAANSDMSCSVSQCYPTANGANLNVGTLQSDLASADDFVVGDLSTETYTGNITIENSISGSNTLTLSSSSGDIIIDDTADSGDLATISATDVDFEAPVVGETSATDSLDVNGSAFFADGATSPDLSSLTVGYTAQIGGSMATTGEQAYTGSLSAYVSTTATLSASTVTVTGTVYGDGGTLTIDGNASLTGVTGVGSLTVTGTSTIVGTIGTTGAQTYEGNLTLNSSSSLAGSDITVDGLTSGVAYPLNINGNATLSLTLLEALSVTGTATLSADVSTTGAQTYDRAVTLTANLTLTGSTVSLDSTIDGADSLTVDDSTLASLGGAVGATTPPTSLTTEGSGSTELSGNITTTGDQDYDQDVALEGDIAFASPGTLDFPDVVSNNAAIELDGPGTMDLTDAGNSFTGGLDVTGGGTVSFVSGGLGPSGTISLDDGTLQWAIGNSSDITPHSIGVGAGGGTVDIGTNDVAFADGIGGAGTLTKTGSGTLTLPADTSYGTSLVVGAGTVDVTGFDVTPVVVGSGATVNVSSTGTVEGAVTVQSDGSLQCDGGWLEDGVTNNGGSLSGAPAAPTGLTASTTISDTELSFTAGAANCYPVSYSAVQVGGDATATGSGSPMYFGPLAVGHSYAFTVTATNPVGSATSATSNSVFLPLPPTVSIATPAQGATYTLNQVVDVSYSCQDSSGGPGIAQCLGSNTSGSALDTAAPGAYTLNVVATSQDGEHTTATITYHVVAGSNRFTVKRLKGAKSGALSCTVSLPGNGTLSVLEVAKGFSTGRLENVKKAGSLSCSLPVNKRLAARIRSKHLKTVKVSISYRPSDGSKRTITRTVRL
jgi:hypothetical protein